MPSRYQELFGEGYRGRPISEERPTGIATGDPKITQLARRRATRVLKAEHKEEFEGIMQAEAEFLQKAVLELPVGEG